MDTPQNRAQSSAAESPRTIKVFICYRRDDASAAAGWLHTLLEKHVYQDRDGAPCRLDLYFDQMEPGVENWKAHLEPWLQTANALIVVCSHGLATDFSKAGVVDWVHRELGWWMDNRSAAPVVVDLTGNKRWLPERIRQRWPDLNRLLVTADELQRNAPDSGNQFAIRLRQRVVETIIESERATNYEELTRTRRRNAQLKLVSALATLVCVAALFAWWRADKAEARAEISRLAAEKQREVSRHTVGFMTRLFAGADPDSNYGASLTVTQLLKAAPATIETESSDLLKANLERALGSAYTGLGDSKSAVVWLKKAEAILANTHVGGEDEFRVNYSLGEAYLYSADAGQFSTALPHLARAQVLVRSAGVDKSEQASLKVSLGDYFAWSSPPDRDKAATHYQDALTIDREAPEDLVGVARDLNRLGNLAHDSQQNSKARTYFKGAVDEVKKLPAGAQALFTAQYEHDFATALFEEGLFSEALERYQKSSESFKAVYGDDSLEYGIAENNAGRILLELDHLEEAGTRVARAVKVESSVAGPQFNGLAFALNTHALTLRAAGKSDQARKEFAQALEVANANDMPIAAQTLVHLAEIELSSGQIDAATTHLERADEQFKDRDMAIGWRYALYENALGELMTRECQLDDARELLSRSGLTLARRWPKGNLFTRMAASRQQVFERTLRGLACHRQSMTE